MNTKPLWSILAAGVCLVLSTQSLQAAGNAEEGKKKFYSCGGCHAIEGYSNAYPNYHVPRIGGQQEKAVLAALNGYKTGDRKHGELPQGNSMQGNSSGWADKDLEDIATFVSKKILSTKTTPITGNPIAGKEKSVVCSGCHGEDGNVLDEQGKVLSGQEATPRLAGQYEDYLIKALQEYRKGELRKNPNMRIFANGIKDDADIKDIAAYFASQKRGLVTISD
ncbi:MAG: c-type cytochrome [Candidatus Methylumidiphilus sp.]